MKGEYFLGDSKKSEKISKKRTLKQNSIFFFDSKLPYETRTIIFIAFRLLETQN